MRELSDDESNDDAPLAAVGVSATGNSKPWIAEFNRYIDTLEP